jgi:phospholipid/cholesterol/gamma-HCH transport system ATP-binding protein
MMAPETDVSVLSFSHVSHSFQDTLGTVKPQAEPAMQTLQDVSFLLPLTGITFLVGRSGSGKSVLCRLAVGLLKPTSGDIHLLGQRIDTASEETLMILRKSCPYVVQGPALLDWKTLEENVGLSVNARIKDEQVSEVMALVGLGEERKTKASLVGPGVKKRAALARALLMKPRAMFVDEPTTGLDARAADAVNSALHSAAERTALVIISHDLEAIGRLAHRVIELEHGSLHFYPSPADFLKRASNQSHFNG